MLMRMLKGYSLERLYPSPYSVMGQCFSKFDKLLEIHVPDVAAHLRQHEVSSSYFLQQWFHTLFLYSQRLELSLRVIDIMVLRKVEALFAVGLAIVVLSRGTGPLAIGQPMTGFPHQH